MLLLLFGQGLAGAATLPLAYYLEDLSHFAYKWLIFILLSGVLHAVSLSGLASAYDKGDLSFVFPLIRGSAILWLTAYTIIFLYNSITVVGMAGVCLVCLGTFVLSKPFAHRGLVTSSHMVGLVIALYSLLDKEAIKDIPPLFYVSILSIATSIFMLPFAFYKHKEDMAKVIKTYPLMIIAVGYGGMFTYYFILLALQQEAAAYVLAMRQISIILTTIVGYYLLHEVVDGKRWLSVVLIISGVILLNNT
jgi:uncharacterized membrane protein